MVIPSDARRLIVSKIARSQGARPMEGSSRRSSFGRHQGARHGDHLLLPPDRVRRAGYAAPQAGNRSYTRSNATSDHAAAAGVSALARFSLTVSAEKTRRLGHDRDAGRTMVAAGAGEVRSGEYDRPNAGEDRKRLDEGRLAAPLRRAGRPLARAHVELTHSARRSGDVSRVQVRDREKGEDAPLR
jgi:hypothetical protein